MGDVAAERKLATVLFADIAGSTELAGRMDAETLRLLLADVYDELSWVVDAYGGTVEKFIGDAVMAVFGVPVAHEDDAERSVRAALVMRSRLGGVALRRGVDVVLRIGVNTGLVVTGTNPGRDFLVTGEAVNLAARLQQAAEPGEILVGERTFAAVEPVVRTAAPRSLRLKGREGPVVAYAVEGLAPASIYRRRRRAYGPFVGRERELALVRALVERSVEHRRPQLVTVIGEPGIGKSRLVEEVVIELQRGLDPPVVWVGRCLPYGEGGPYAPLRDLLLRAAAVSEADSREEARSKVRGQLLALLGDDAAQTVEQVLRFVSPLTVPAEDSDEDPGERGREAWHELLLTFAARRPALLVIDDVHWAEPALLGLVAGVVQGTTRVPLAVVCIGRDELLLNHPTWGSGARNETTITLEALEEEDMRRLAFALAQHGDPSAEVIAQAGGNPFFLEEILAMAGEGAAMVPDTVQGVIAARLDMLPAAEKRLLQRAAVIGRAFDLDTLRALAGEEASAGELRELVTRDFVVQTGGTGHSFKHGLIRDVAYESIARAERARLHMALAGYLDGQGAGRQPVAYHYAAAAGLGLQEARAEAVERLLEAAAEAHSVYAHGSAMRQATRALALAEDDRERAMAQEAVGDAHWMAERSNEAWEAYRLALEHGVKAGLSRHVMARLRWKFVDLPTRWGAGKPMADASDEVQHELELGLADARAVGDRAREARFLVARALTGWHSADRTAQQLEAALRDARAAYAIGGELERPAICSAALDAEAMALLALSRYADARAAADTRFELVPKLRRREEQIDACTMAARARIGTGDYSGALQAAGTALDLMRGSGQHWLAWPLLERCDAFFWWDRWDEVLDAFQEFLSVYRSTGPRRRSTPPSRATGMAVAVHLLRGDREMADALEQRADLPPEGYHTVAVSHALLGCGEPELALDRLPKIHVGRLGVVAVSAEANAMLERWDVVDALLAEAAASPGLDQAPRLAAQLDRARGMAGDEIALRRAADGFDRLGCRFEHARCLELQGHAARARHVYESLGAVPALDRVSA